MILNFLMFKILIWFSFHLISDEIICKCNKKNFIILEDFWLSSLQSILVKAPKGSVIWPIFPAYDRQTIDTEVQVLNNFDMSDDDKI